MEITSKTSTNLDDHYICELEKNSESLIESLKAEKYEDALGLLRSVVPSQDQQVYTCVGNLTRALHDAIVNFNVDAEVIENFDIEPHSDISDASDRLQYVISMTQEAADKTMDRVEIAAPIALNLGQEAALLKTEWDKLKRRELSKDDFAHLYERMGEFFGQMVDGTEQLNSNLQAIILEQGYQDLTGQVLKKVIGLVTDVESELVNLVRMASQVEDVAGLKKSIVNDVPEEVASIGAEGPQIHAETRQDVVNGQDDVDDLLSSLGF